MVKTIESIMNELSATKPYKYADFIKPIVIDGCSFDLLKYRETVMVSNNDIFMYNLIYNKVYETYKEPERLTIQELQLFTQSILDVYFESRLLHAGMEPGAKNFQTPTHISNKVSKHWENNHKHSLTCPVETYVSGTTALQHSWSTSALTASYNYAFNNLDVFMVNALELNILSQNNISKDVSCQVKVYGFKYQGKYYLRINTIDDTGEHSNFESSYIDFDDFLMNTKLKLSEFIFNAYYRDRIKDLTDDTIEFKDFSFDVYNAIFDMIKI